MVAEAEGEAAASFAARSAAILRSAASASNLCPLRETGLAGTAGASSVSSSPSSPPSACSSFAAVSTVAGTAASHGEPTSVVRPSSLAIALSRARAAACAAPTAPPSVSAMLDRPVIVGNLEKRRLERLEAAAAAWTLRARTTPRELLDCSARRMRDRRRARSSGSSPSSASGSAGGGTGEVAAGEREKEGDADGTTVTSLPAVECSSTSCSTASPSSSSSAVAAPRLLSKSRSIRSSRL